MEAIMYAAGAGRRLEMSQGERPKVLVEVGGRSLLEWHVMRLLENGIEALTIVTGYEREKIGFALESLRRQYPLKTGMLINESYVEGSVLSLAVSLPWLESVKAPVLLMDGDVLYPAAMLRRLIDSKSPTALLIDRDYSTADDDPVLVPVRDGQPFEFVKGWSGKADQVGESIGFFKVSAPDIQLLADETRRRVASGGRKDSYDEVLRVLVKAGRFGHEDVTGMPWTEIDFPWDLDRARQVVWPAIERFGKHEN